MKLYTVFLFLLVPCSLVLLSACGPTTPEATPQPTAIPTSEATSTPQATPTETRVESDFYFYRDGEWVRLYEDEITFPFLLPEDMQPEGSENYQMIQTGYFAAYDSDTQVMSMRALVIMAKMYREVQFQMDEGMVVFCLPAQINDTPIEEISYLYNEKGVGFPPGPGNTTLGEIVSAFDTDTYMVLILDAPVDPLAINMVVRIAAICPE